MLHSVIPQELILEGMLNPTAARPTVEFCRRDGMLFELTNQSGERHIRRLYSTDPKVYLNPALSPGQRF